MTALRLPSSRQALAAVGALAAKPSGVIAMLRRRLSREALIAVAALFGLVAALLLWSVAYLVQMHGLRAQFETKQQSLAALRRQTEPRLSGKDKIAQSTGRAAIISAPTETVAASQLQKTVLSSLEKAGGAVHSVQAETTTDVTGEGLHRLNVQVTFDASIGALQKVLFDVETAIPFVFIDSLLVQPAAAASGGESSEKLRITLVASSYWKGPEAADTKP